VTAAIGTLEWYRLTDTARQDYLSSHEGERFAEPMRRVRTYPEQLPVLRDPLPTIEAPVLIINGAKDPVVPPVNACYPPAAAHEPARHHRRGTLPPGRRGRYLRGVAHKLVGRRLHQCRLRLSAAASVGRKSAGPSASPQNCTL
jgi:pimeloyl-ACP methyl ester carboxylesterase